MIIPKVEPDKQKLVIDIVDQLIDLKKKIRITKSPQSQEILKRRIEILDRKIDQLVYQLYGLADEEIRIVESGGS